MKGLIVYNGFLNPGGPAFLSDFQCAGEELGIEIAAAASGDFLIRNGRTERPECHFCLFLDKDMNLYRALEEQNIRLFNSYRTISVCDSKCEQLREFEGEYMPESYCAPKCYHTGRYWKGLAAIGERLGFPLVVKESRGSWGEQVYLAEDEEALARIYAEHSDRELLFQKFIRESFGRDGRVVVVGGRVVGAVCRRARPGEFRANCELGGTAEPMILDEATRRMCLAAAKRVGADFCGIDLLFGSDRTYLCEINASPGFANFNRATGTRTELEILKYVQRKIREKN